MACLHPKIVLTPESRFLLRCRKEGKSFEYYVRECGYRRNKFLDPVPIVDNPHDYYFGKTLLRNMVVPCGKCELCCSKKINDYVIRNYFEFVDLSSYDSAYMITLTYADEILPTLEDGTPCFCSSDIKNFFKRLRAFLGNSLSIKYFVTAELGTDMAYTHRPHYHGCLYIHGLPYSQENTYMVLEAVAKSWTKIVDRNARFRQLWDCQRVDVKPVEDVSQIVYICKYIGKQLGAEDFDELVKNDPEHQRKHWQSVGFGSPFWKFVTSEELEKGTICVNGFNYSIPSYYLTKIGREFYCENIDGSIVYVPTDFKQYWNENMIAKCYEESCKLCVLNKDYPDPRNYVKPEYLNELLEGREPYLSYWNSFREALFNWNHKNDLFKAQQIQEKRLKNYADKVNLIKR